MDIEELASEAYNSFERKDRNGKSIVVKKNDCPDWVADIVYDAHQDIMPDDWTYETIRDAFSDIADGDTEFSGDADVMNADLLNWVQEYSPASGFIDQAIDEMGPATDFYNGIQMGQYLARRTIFDIVMEGLSSRLAEIEEEEQEQDVL